MAVKRSTGANMNVLGGWAFLIGVILAVIIGIGVLEQSTGLAIVLLIIGIIIGLLNIGEHEVGAFLMSGVVLIIAASLGGDALAVVSWLDNVFKNLLAIFVPATIVVAIKHAFSLARR